MRVLIVKIGAVGDAILALSMIEAIAQQNPAAHITWICGESIEPLLRAVIGIKEIIPINERNLFKGNLLLRAITLGRLWLRLFGRRFDLVVTGHSDRRYRWLTVPVLAKIRRGFSVHGARGKLVPGRFHGDEYVRLVTGTDGPDAPKAGIVQIATGLLTECSVIPHNSGPVVAIAPGGARNVLRDDALRRWPAENYADLTKRLLTDGIQVVLTGSPSDDWVRERFRHLPIIDLVGKTTLIELIAIYRACDLVITHDSGPMHLAAAAGARVVAVFGPTNPNEKVLVGGGIRVLWGGERLACRPCYDGRNYADCHDNRCLKEITVGAVYEEVAKILKQRRETKRCALG